MKKIFALFLTISSFYITKADYWTQKADYGGGNSINAVACTIASKGYVGLGIDSNSNYTPDWWEFDPVNNSWTQKANFPGNLRQGASAFSVGNTAYIGLGWGPQFLNDFWKYDLSSNAWTQMPDFAGSRRDFACAFSINAKGYFTCGLDSTGPTSDLWEYDPLGGSWTQKASATSGVFAAVSFVINNKGYVASGYGPLATHEYDPPTNSWNSKMPLPFLLVSAAGFSVGTNGYLGTGIINLTLNTMTKEFWQYNSITDTWTQKTDFGGVERTGAVGFSIGQKGYLGCAVRDFWEYTPDNSTGISDLGFTISDFSVYPNPAKDELTVTSTQFGVGKKVEITITDISGKLCLRTPNSQLPTKIEIRQFLQGIYFIKIDEGKKKGVKRFLKE